MSVQTPNFTLRGLFLLPCLILFVLLQCLLREVRDLVGFVPNQWLKVRLMQVVLASKGGLQR